MSSITQSSWTNAPGFPNGNRGLARALANKREILTSPPLRQEKLRSTKEQYRQVQSLVENTTKIPFKNNEDSHLRHFLCITYITVESLDFPATATGNIGIGGLDALARAPVHPKMQAKHVISMPAQQRRSGRVVRVVALNQIQTYHTLLLLLFFSST